VLRSINRIGIFGIGHAMLTLMIFALIFAPSASIKFGDSLTNLIQPAFAQPEDPFPQVSNETLTPAQREAREQLLKAEGFSVNVIARNLSAPLNLLYGPDDVLWITERTGKDIVRIDPTNGAKLSAMPIPNVNQSKGQDGVLGMAFDPDFKNTHYIYVAYTYEEDSGEGVSELKTKIIRFTYNQDADNISEPMDLISGLSGSGDHNSGRMTFGPEE
jgi:glucose/arabinose dehydrogenase